MQTFEQVDEHVKAHSEVITEAASSPEKGKKLGKIWMVARPILDMVSHFPLLPKKWRGVITVLITAIDEAAVPE
jgi:hypothetical protein